MNNNEPDKLTREDMQPGHFFRRLTRAYAYLIVSIDPGPWRKAGVWYDEYIGTPFPKVPDDNTKWRRTMRFHGSLVGFMSRRLKRVPFPDLDKIIPPTPEEAARQQSAENFVKSKLRDVSFAFQVMPMTKVEEP